MNCPECGTPMDVEYGKNPPDAITGFPKYICPSCGFIIPTLVKKDVFVPLR